MTDLEEEKNNKENNEDEGAEHEEDHDPQFEPVIYLPEVHIFSMEENEDELVKLRAKLFRYDKSEEPHQWKERGTGEIKILWHTERRTVRVLMRRDKTLKICANHYVTPWMQLKPNCDSDRAWVWSVPADFADETPKSELLAVRFANSENANKFKDAFEEGKRLAQLSDADKEEESDEEDDDEEEESNKAEGNEEKDDETNEVTNKLNQLEVAAEAETDLPDH